MSGTEGLYIALISIHGLIRGSSLELGRDADTGGQTKYVLDLALALSKQDAVSNVELITRKIIDDDVDLEYRQERERLNSKCSILRIESGPDAYLPKEQLWDHLDSFTDQLFSYFNACDRMPDVLHSHYADAGYVATHLSHLTGIPLVHTGHSLGRDKLKRLMATGLSKPQLEERYNFSMRIDAEEEVLSHASMVITSTYQEVTDQYDAYDGHRPEIMKVVPPGTQLEQFHPPELGAPRTKLAVSIKRFLNEPDKPMILALSRPDPRKNITSLMKAYGESSELQELANLVIIAGNRDDIRKMDDGAQEVMTELLILIDRYNLYGKVALPKKHLPEEVASAYRMAASSRGVFVNPALTEPFGLTLLEAAACGLPFVATENGGPVDIVKNCRAGELIDPLDLKAIESSIKKILLDGELWRRHSANGIKNVIQKYSWDTHAQTYLKHLKDVVAQERPVLTQPSTLSKPRRHVDRMLISDLDKTLLSDTRGLNALSKVIREKRKECAFGIATSRRLDVLLGLLKKYNLPRPDVLICSLGTEIYYSSELNISTGWNNHIDHNWNPQAIKRILSQHGGLKLQDEKDQSRFKLSYELSVSDTALTYEDMVAILRREDQAANVFFSQNQHIDITPARASKGTALRYVAQIWDIPLENILVAGGSGTDEDMLAGNIKGVIVRNRQHEALSPETNEDSIFYSHEPNALGVLEAIEHYQFFK